MILLIGVQVWKGKACHCTLLHLHIFFHLVTSVFSYNCYFLNALKHKQGWGANEALQVYVLCVCVTINAADVTLLHINSLVPHLFTQL